MLEPGDQIEKFEVLEEMGAGGMARVFKVRHTLLGSLHALKVLDPQFVRDAEMRQRFLAEGQIQAKLRHPNIVQVTDIIAAPGVAGLVVEYIDGRALDEHIDQMTSPPTGEEVKELFGPLLSALGYAHAHDVIHRDIKPANILLSTGPDGRLVPKIVDFGIAKVLGDGLGPGQAKGRTRTGARMGTLHYMSPEQVKGAAGVDARSDIYSIAATLYEFVTLQVPFDADSEYDTMKKIVEFDAMPVREVIPTVDPIIDACVAMGLSKDPARRFQSCAEFAVLLERVGTSAAPPVLRSSRGPPARSVSHPPPPSPSREPSAPPVLQPSVLDPPAPRPVERAAKGMIPPKKVSPILACFASLFCLSCVGHLMIGQYAKGLFLMLCGMGLNVNVPPLGVAVSFVAAFDAYRLAKKLKGGQAIGKWEWF